MHLKSISALWSSKETSRGVRKGGTVLAMTEINKVFRSGWDRDMPKVSEGHSCFCLNSAPCDVTSTRKWSYLGCFWHWLVAFMTHALSNRTCTFKAEPSCHSFQNRASGISSATQTYICTELTLQHVHPPQREPELIPLMLSVSCGYKNRNISKHETWMKR